MSKIEYTLPVVSSVIAAAVLTFGILSGCSSNATEADKKDEEEESKNTPKAPPPDGPGIRGMHENIFKTNLDQKGTSPLYQHPDDDEPNILKFPLAS